MRRADRLFRIVQSLRRRKLTTAQRLADELEISTRTVYRDVADLVASGVPIAGEAGVGYVLGRGFDLPPLLFNDVEIEALVLGARVVESWADDDLKTAARQVLEKVEAVLPERLRDRLQNVTVFAPGFHVPQAMKRQLRPLRSAIAARRKVRLRYADQGGKSTVRTIRPLGLFFWGGSWTVAAWCELRRDFRGFRLDRAEELDLLDDRFSDEKGKTLGDYLKAVRGELG